MRLPYARQAAPAKGLGAARHVGSRILLLFYPRFLAASSVVFGLAPTVTFRGMAMLSLPRLCGWMLIAALPLLSGCNAVLLALRRRGPAAAQPDHHIHRADAADHRAGDPAHLPVRVALPRQQQGRALRSRMEPLHRAGAADLGGAAAHHHRAGRADLGQHPPARSLPSAGAPVRRPRGAARHQAAGGGSGGAGLEMAVPLSRTGRRRRQ